MSYPQHTLVLLFDFCWTLNLFCNFRFGIIKQFRILRDVASLDICDNFFCCSSWKWQTGVHTTLVYIEFDVGKCGTMNSQLNCQSWKIYMNLFTSRNFFACMLMQIIRATYIRQRLHNIYFKMYFVGTLAKLELFACEILLINLLSNTF